VQQIGQLDLHRLLLAQPLPADRTIVIGTNPTMIEVQMADMVVFFHHRMASNSKVCSELRRRLVSSIDTILRTA
jgi:hypothetical protein